MKPVYSTQDQSTRSNQFTHVGQNKPYLGYEKTFLEDQYDNMIERIKKPDNFTENTMERNDITGMSSYDDVYRTMSDPKATLLDKAIEMMKELDKKAEEAEKQGEESAKKTDPEKLEKATKESPTEAPEEEQAETIEEFKLRTATEKYDAIKAGLDSKKEELKNETDEAKKEILQNEVDKIQANLDIAKAAIDKYKETAEEGSSTDLWTISAILSLAEERLNNLGNNYPING
jgi:hypothetical protein